jgi:hypothetical protein
VAHASPLYKPWLGEIYIIILNIFQICEKNIRHQLTNRIIENKNLGNQTLSYFLKLKSSYEFGITSVQAKMLYHFLAGLVI